MLTSLISGEPVQTADRLAVDASRTVCISGHREKSITPYNGNPVYQNITVSAVRLMLERYIDMAAERGYVSFISGLATGADLWAADYIIRKRRQNSSIRLIGAMPYLRHAERFSAADKRLLAMVEHEADQLITVDPDPNIVYSKTHGRGSPDLYRNRNYYMVDNSSAVIAFFNSGETYSGTAQTLNYANRRSRQVCRFGLEDVFRIIDSSGTDLRNIARTLSFLDNVFDLPL